MSFLYTTYTIVNAEIRRNATPDFEQFLELEGILDYKQASLEENLDLVIIDWCAFVGHYLNTPKQNLNDPTIVKDVCRAKTVIFANSLVHIPVSEVLKNKIDRPKDWPDRKYKLIHYFSNPIVSNINDWIEPVYYNYHLNVMLSYWNRFPYKSSTNVFIRRDINLIFKPAKITNPRNRNKLFVSANKLRPTLTGREIINKIIVDYKHKGYFGSITHQDTDWVNGNYLRGQLEDPTINHELSWNPVTQKLNGKFSDIELTLDLVMDKGNIPHTYYYENSFFSIVGESLDHEDVVVSEKTLIPIINGHWVVPYGGPGTVKTLRDMGIKMAPWIDYSYDSVDISLEERRKLFEKEIRRLCELSLKEWTDLTERNIDILHENRQLLWHRPFDRLGIKSWN